MEMADEILDKVRNGQCFSEREGIIIMKKIHDSGEYYLNQNVLYSDADPILCVLVQRQFDLKRMEKRLSSAESAASKKVFFIKVDHLM